MHDCCSYRGTDSFISVIDHLPAASSPFLCISVWIFTPPPPARSKKKKKKSDTLVFAACPSAPLISSSFPAPSIPPLHQVSAPQPDLSHLGSQGLCDGRREVHCQLIRMSFSSRCCADGGKVRAADSGGRGKEKKKRSLHLLFLPERGRANIRPRDGGESPLGSIKATILHQLHRWQTSLSSLWATSGPIINRNLLCMETIIHGSNWNFLNNLG